MQLLPDLTLSVNASADGRILQITLQAESPINDSTAYVQ
jgi:hypothetical protein